MMKTWGMIFKIHYLEEICYVSVITAEVDEDFRPFNSIVLLVVGVSHSL